jgi:hypothetical protein
MRHFELFFNEMYNVSRLKKEDMMTTSQCARYGTLSSNVEYANKVVEHMRRGVDIDGKTPNGGITEYYIDKVLDDQQYAIKMLQDHIRDCPLCNS